MKKVIFLFIVMVLLPLASSAQDEKTEEWQSDLLRGDGYAQSGDADAAWLFYERSMAKGLDDGKALFRVAQAYDRQRLYGNPDFGEVLYSVAARFLQEQDPQSPEFEEALIQSGTLGVADQRILRRAYSHFGGRPPHRPFPYFTLDYWKERFSQNRMSSEPHAMDEHPQEMDDNSAMTSMDPMEASRRVLSPLRFLKQQFHVLRTGWHVWKSSGQRVFWAWLQVHWKEAMVAYTLLSALTGILLPAVLGYSVAREGRKSYVAAYLFLLHWGPLGIHRFYLGRWKTALLWLFTGGFFGLGLFLDLFLTGTYVRVWNEDHRGERNSTRSHSSPRGSSSRSLKKGQSIKKLGKPQGMSSQKESRQSKKALRQRTKQSHKSRSGKSKKKRQSEGSDQTSLGATALTGSGMATAATLSSSSIPEEEFFSSPGQKSSKELDDMASSENLGSEDFSFDDVQDEIQEMDQNLGAPNFTAQGDEDSLVMDMSDNNVPDAEQMEAEPSHSELESSDSTVPSDSSENTVVSIDDIHHESSSPLDAEDFSDAALDSVLDDLSFESSDSAEGPQDQGGEELESLDASFEDMEIMDVLEDAPGESSDDSSDSESPHPPIPVDEKEMEELGDLLGDEGIDLV